MFEREMIELMKVCILMRNVALAAAGKSGFRTGWLMATSCRDWLLYTSAVLLTSVSSVYIMFNT